MGVSVGFAGGSGQVEGSFWERGRDVRVQNCPKLLRFFATRRVPPVVPFEDVRKAANRCFDASQVQTSQSFKQA